MTINDRVKIIIETLYNGNKRRFSSAIGVAPTVKYSRNKAREAILRCVMQSVLKCEYI